MGDHNHEKICIDSSLHAIGHSDDIRREFESRKILLILVLGIYYFRESSSLEDLLEDPQSHRLIEQMLLAQDICAYNLGNGGSPFCC